MLLFDFIELLFLVMLLLAMAVQCFSPGWGMCKAQNVCHTCGRESGIKSIGGPQVA